MMGTGLIFGSALFSVQPQALRAFSLWSGRRRLPCLRHGRPAAFARLADLLTFAEPF
jgi:hypothetical protein